MYGYMEEQIHKQTYVCMDKWMNKYTNKRMAVWIHQ